jgi:glycosyltransferase involved in cell wall biosynthesis
MGGRAVESMDRDVRGYNVARMAVLSGHAFIVPAYGESPYLADCLRSLRAQTLPSHIEIATSTPSPFIARLAQAHGAPVRINPRRVGIGADWNFALEGAGARYVTLAHQDDVYAPDFLSETLAAFARHPEASIAFTGYREIGDQGEVRDSKISRIKHLIESLTLGESTLVTPSRLRRYLALGNPLPCSSVTFDRERLAVFRFSEVLSSNLDWQAWLDLADQGVAFARVPARLVGRRHNPLTETARLIKSGVRAREDLAMFRRIWPSPVAELIAAVYRLGY